MATQTKKSRASRSRAPLRELTRLRAEVLRLRAELSTLKAKKSAETNREQPAAGETLPALPPQDADGNYPAAEALNIIVARQIIRRRQALGWTQAELARRAGVRPETLSRLETGKHAPNVATVDKLDQALRNAGA
jgi:DNA-binding XRE family transcriptional regulator